MEYNSLIGVCRVQLYNSSVQMSLQDVNAWWLKVKYEFVDVAPKILQDEIYTHMGIHPFEMDAYPSII